MPQLGFHHVLIRLSFLCAPFLRASCLVVDENVAIRAVVVAGEVGRDGDFSFLDHAQVLHAERMAGRVRALLGSWNARAKGAMTGNGVRCISRRDEDEFDAEGGLRCCKWCCPGV
jgi:hypothetical protein